MRPGSRLGHFLGSQLHFLGSGAKLQPVSCPSPAGQACDVWSALKRLKPHPGFLVSPEILPAATSLTPAPEAQEGLDRLLRRPPPLRGRGPQVRPISAHRVWHRSGPGPAGGAGHLRGRGHDLGGAPEAGSGRQQLQIVVLCSGHPGQKWQAMLGWEAPPPCSSAATAGSRRGTCSRRP